MALVTHVVVRQARSVEGPSPYPPYRGYPGDGHGPQEELVYGLAPACVADHDTSTRASLAWSLVGCALVFSLLLAAATSD